MPTTTEPAPVRNPGTPALLCVLLMLAALLLPSGATAELPRYEQRSLYKRALSALEAGRTSEYRQARAALDGYVLQPYLDYHELRRSLSTLSSAQMQRFLAAHGDLPVAELLYRRWLKNLGQRRDWRRLLAEDIPTGDAELDCYRLRAELAQGLEGEARRRVFAAVPPLWRVGRSQPKACDPLFDTWIAAGQLTPELAWERLRLSLAANERTLARYLLRFFDGYDRTLAEAFISVHVSPEGIDRQSALKQDGARTREVLLHGIERLAGRDPGAARAAWARIDRRYDFSPTDRNRVQEALLPALAAAGEFPDRVPTGASAATLAGVAQAAVEQQRWPLVREWLAALPAEAAGDPRWRYWHGRAVVETGGTPGTATAAHPLSDFQCLATERHYYGFLAAEQLGLAMQLEWVPRTDTGLELKQLERIPAVARALELYAVDDLLNARREWYALLPTLDADEQRRAAELALRIGWVDRAVHTANSAGLHDDLALRFPLAYRDAFQRVSHATTVPHALLIAIARQESAFDPRARSSANARGLMQLLPSTATLVARRARLPEPDTAALYDPTTNTELGGHHLAWLLDEFSGSRPLAAAAYNAGERRVERWIRDHSGEPMDVWIETIPFRETRNYVKNVLAFAQVYGQLLGTPRPMLEAHETRVP